MLGNYLQQTTFSSAFFLGALRVKRVVQVGENFQSLILLNYWSVEVKLEGIDFLGNFYALLSSAVFFLQSQLFQKKKSGIQSKFQLIGFKDNTIQRVYLLNQSAPYEQNNQHKILFNIGD